MPQGSSSEYARPSQRPKRGVSLPTVAQSKLEYGTQEFISSDI